MTSVNYQRAFRVMSYITIAAVYFLILVGGIVRASGSGMGCPDWPKCFGRWIPPTDVSQLPENYQEIYAHRGYADTEFNPVKTWIEYINRLVGVSIGILIFITLLLSFSYWKTDRAIVVASLLAFLLVGFNGWLGAVVVASNLVPVIITLHMIAALLVVGALVYASARTRRGPEHFGALKPGTRVPWLIAAVLVLSLVQLWLGTQVREQVDELMVSMGDANRAQWANEFGRSFYVHRSLSLLVLLLNVALFLSIARNTTSEGALLRGAYFLLVLIVAEIIAGVVLYYGGMPATFQPVHLLLAALLFGTQFYLAIAYKLRTRTD